MHWADEIAEKIIDSGKHKPYHVDDMKTPSGFAHVGSLMGPVVHSIIYRALKKRGLDVVYTFVINDFDVVDGLSSDLKEEYGKYMGFPLKTTPSPDPSFDSMADCYADDFISSFRSLGVEATTLSSWEMYHEGKFDDLIRIALDNGEKIQDIYKKVSGSDKKSAGWLPLQVICENCGKLGTTRVFDWNGETVGYKCEPNLVEWAQGCGHEGKISPFGGNGKLPWKVDWPAHWKVIGVTVEGAGKDHASAGGSYDIAMALCEEVFNYEKPFRIPYEFILIGGRKMSSSKGLGLKAHGLVKILPPELGRFLFAKHNIKSQSNFDPAGTSAIPDLFDQYDKAAVAFWDKTDETLASTFEYSQISDSVSEKHFLPRFIDVAKYLQDAKVSIYEKFEEVKGSPLNEVEIKTLEERIKYAKIWLSDYAPKDEVFTPSNEIPAEAKDLSEKQKEYLSEVAKLLDTEWTPEDLQTALYEKSKKVRLGGKEAFGAIYLALIGKTHGPKAAWFLLEHKDIAVKRFEEVNSIPEPEELVANESGYTIANEVKEKFPGISFAYTVISDVNIKKHTEELENRKEKLFEEKSKFSYEEIRALSPIASYILMLKTTKVDTGSHRPSPEALLRRISQGKEIYNVNTAVDAYNLAVIETGIGLGGFDYDKIAPPVVLRFSKVGEEMHLLGDQSPVKTVEGQLVYADSEKLLTLDLNYRDIDKTKITIDTKNIILFADGGVGIDIEEVKSALQKGAEYIQKYCGGNISDIHLVR